EALGKRIRIAAVDDWREIIGVVGDVHDDGGDSAPRAAVYGPTLVAKSQGRRLHAYRYITCVVRSPLAGAENLISQIRQAVWSVDANLPLASVYTMNHLYTGSL